MKIDFWGWIKKALELGIDLAGIKEVFRGFFNAFAKKVTNDHRAIVLAYMLALGNVGENYRTQYARWCKRNETEPGTENRFTDSFARLYIAFEPPEGDGEKENKKQGEISGENKKRLEELRKSVFTTIGEIKNEEEFDRMVYFLEHDVIEQLLKLINKTINDQIQILRFELPLGRSKDRQRDLEEDPVIADLIQKGILKKQSKKGFFRQTWENIKLGF